MRHWRCSGCWLEGCAVDGGEKEDGLVCVIDREICGVLFVCMGSFGVESVQ